MFADVIDAFHQILDTKSNDKIAYVPIAHIQVNRDTADGKPNITYRGQVIFYDNPKRNENGIIYSPDSQGPQELDIFASEIIQLRRTAGNDYEVEWRQTNFEIKLKNSSDLEKEVQVLRERYGLAKTEVYFWKSEKKKESSS